jgi:hypothetical protein
VVFEAGKRWIFSSGKTREEVVSRYDDEQRRQTEKDAIYCFKKLL